MPKHLQVNKKKNNNISQKKILFFIDNNVIRISNSYP